MTAHAACPPYKNKYNCQIEQSVITTQNEPQQNRALLSTTMSLTMTTFTLTTGVSFLSFVQSSSSLPHPVLFSAHPKSSENPNMDRNKEYQPNHPRWKEKQKNESAQYILEVNGTTER